MEAARKEEKAFPIDCHPQFSEDLKVRENPDPQFCLKKLIKMNTSQKMITSVLPQKVSHKAKRLSSVLPQKVGEVQRPSNLIEKVDHKTIDDGPKFNNTLINCPRNIRKSKKKRLSGREKIKLYSYSSESKQDSQQESLSQTILDVNFKTTPEERHISTQSSIEPKQDGNEEISKMNHPISNHQV
jgi:hypothetical protein